MPISRHYQRARQDRGAETRAKLIIAALDSFGRHGFDGASTREIAKRAGANLAAIVYHFGSKEALHRAVAEHVVGELKQRMGPTLASAAQQMDTDPPEPTAARALLQSLVEAQITSMLGEASAEMWARFIVREQMETSASFEIVAQFMDEAHQITRRLVAVLLGIDPASDEATIRVFALMGQIVMFRVAQPMVLRSLGRSALDADDRARITRIVTENIDRIIGIPAERAGSP